MASVTTDGISVPGALGTQAAHDATDNGHASIRVNEHLTARSVPQEAIVHDHCSGAGNAIVWVVEQRFK